MARDTDAATHDDTVDERDDWLRKGTELIVELVLFAEEARSRVIVAIVCRKSQVFYVT